jgi:hypothetical protein
MNTRGTKRGIRRTAHRFYGRAEVSMVGRKNSERMRRALASFYHPGFINRHPASSPAL